MDSQAGNAGGNKALEEYLGRWGVRLLVLRGGMRGISNPARYSSSSPSFTKLVGMTEN